MPRPYPAPTNPAIPEPMRRGQPRRVIRITTAHGWLADLDGEHSELTWRTKVASPNSAAGD